MGVSKRFGEAVIPLGTLREDQQVGAWRVGDVGALNSGGER
ncbi:MAG: Uncharacterised protein [Cellulomonadaceae bacterium TMED98]|nr:MAG: Uncharacterised protein [Cellulomonadaceae bacterium TMED98]